MVKATSVWLRHLSVVPAPGSQMLGMLGRVLDLPSCGRLRHVEMDLAHFGLTLGDLQWLCATLQACAHLAVLSLVVSENRLRGPAAAFLRAAAALPSLTELRVELSVNEIPPELSTSVIVGEPPASASAAPTTSSPSSPRVHPPVSEWEGWSRALPLAAGIRILWVGMESSGLRSVEAGRLAELRRLPRLESLTLVLFQNSLGDEGVEAVVRVAEAPALYQLAPDVSDCLLTAAAMPFLRALRRCVNPRLRLSPCAA